MNIVKQTAKLKDRSVTIGPDGSLKTKDGLYMFKLVSGGYNADTDKPEPRKQYILAPEIPTIEDIKEYLLSDPQFEDDVVGWYDSGYDWKEFIEIEKVRVV